MKNKLHSNNELLWIPSAIPFFIFGCMYYLMSPSLTLAFFGESIIALAAKNYISLDYFDTRYFIDCLVIIISWLCGYFFALKIKYSKTILDKLSGFNTAPIILASFFMLLLFFLVINTKLKGTIFFTGYGAYDVVFLGQMATILFMSVWFINYFQKRYVKLFFISIFLITSILMLGLGSRMFFVLGIISLILAFFSSNKKILSNPLLYLFLFGLLVFVIWIGVWRSGAEISIEGLVTVFLAEPLFTATSGSIYIKNIGGRPLIAFPVDLFVSFINFIPTIIFPEKLKMMSILMFDENKYSPFGASSIIVNIYSNFGVFYPIYFFVIGLFYGSLKKRARYSKFYYATYLSLLPLLMFHFFREGFVTVFKVMFFNGFILPAIIIGLCVFVFHKKTKKKRIANI